MEYHEDYRPKPLSPRNLLAARLAEFICENGLAEVYGGEEKRSEDKRYHHIGFSKRRNLDGEIKVFSEEYIVVSYKTTFRDLPGEDRRLYDSEAAVKEFLKLAFVDLNFRAALAVPQKIVKKRQPKGQSHVQEFPKTIAPDHFGTGIPSGEPDDDVPF